MRQIHRQRYSANTCERSKKKANPGNSKNQQKANHIKNNLEKIHYANNNLFQSKKERRVAKLIQIPQPNLIHQKASPKDEEGNQHNF